LAPHSTSFYVGFFEIYGGKVSDLLNDKKKLMILEDANSKIQIQGLEYRQASSAKELIEIIDFGHSERTTHCTAANDTSSRSHAVC
jgi:kinesin family member 2/24